MDVALIDWCFFDPTAASGLEVGALISADAGGMPIYRVMALTSGRAWLRNVEDGDDRLMPLSEFHWRANA